MKTDVIRVSSKGSQIETALQQAEKVAAYKGLSGKNAMHLRLLTEEMMGLMRSITGETEGDFWMEDVNGEYRLYLQIDTTMTSRKREQLLAASTSGKNEAARGLMGRLRDFLDQGADADIAGMGSPTMFMEGIEHSSTPAMDWEWSMIRYEAALTPYVKREEAEAVEAWDELEKSVVARVADDVKVSMKGRTVTLTIVKKMD